GVFSLMRDFPDVAVRAFVRFPCQLGKTAKVLGSVDYEHCATLLRRIADHPLFTTDFTQLAPKEATLAIQRTCAGRYWNPIPRHLAAWARGTYTLTPTRVARYHRLVVERLDRTRLDFIEQHVIEALARALPVPTVTRKNVRHALQLLGGLDDNRRGLRQFLRAHWTGDQDYLSRHPRTRHWVRRHPRVNVELWTSGIVFESPAATALRLTLGIEQDPLEVLRLGTYVGSCLGLGGLCDYSAAAVLLDVNKQVLYARDRHGSVVARQLIALSKVDEVVCFNVYPESSPTPIKALFRAYDVALAEALGLARYIPKSHYDRDYEIEHILSEKWWDDALMK
ncbi:MAG: hypothetical protein HOP18_25945, partial [Deltaproteobacteria bacterium]|nr:hypothetical protein [Deltaproteobacteria bacterium]